MRKFVVILILSLLTSGLAASFPLQEKKVDLNRANEVELQELPGIGPALAKRIVEHRTQNGPFKKLVDLLNVSGIGTKKFEVLESLLTLGPAKPLNDAGGKKGKTPPVGH